MKDKTVRCGALLFLLIALSGTCSAEIATIGLLSFDQPLTDNQFTVSNYTGFNSLPPDAPVVDALVFKNVEIQYFLESGASAVIGPLGVDPGAAYPFDNSTFDPSIQITEAVITGTLGSATFSADFGSGPALYEADDLSFSATLLPSSGTVLIGGIDFVPIAVNVSPAQVNTTSPEPRMILPSFVIVGSLLILRRHFASKYRS